MRFRIPITPLGIGVLFLVVASALAYVALSMTNSTTNVLVATTTIQAFSAVQPNQVETRQVPTAGAEPGALSTIQPGEYVSTTVFPGEEITSRDILASNPAASPLVAAAAAQHNPDLGTITIPTGDITNGTNGITPGTRLDIIGTFNVQGSNSVNTAFVRIPVAGVPVVGFVNNGQGMVVFATPSQAMAISAIIAWGRMTVYVNPPNANLAAALSAQALVPQDLASMSITGSSANNNTSRASGITQGKSGQSVPTAPSLTVKP